MEKTVREKSAARRLAAAARQNPESRGRPEDCGGDPHAKGAMREPAQTPSGERGGLGEVQEALEDLEKEKGDWSKGG
jgi:hypothetical protein